MHKLILFLALLALIAAFFYPKQAGASLCGQPCQTFGLRYYEQPCFGIKVRDDSGSDYSDICYGRTYGEKTCYGVPYTETENSAVRQLSCDYPCRDSAIRSLCLHLISLPQTESPLHSACPGLINKCNWR
jgi:hypothetical protein